MHSTERESSWDIFQTFKVYGVTLEAMWLEYYPQRQNFDNFGIFLGTISLSAPLLLLKACKECQDGFYYIFSSTKWCLGFHLSIILIYQLVRVETLDVNIIKQSFYKNLFRKEFKTISWYIPREGLMMREWPYTASSWASGYLLVVGDVQPNTSLLSAVYGYIT